MSKGIVSHRAQGDGTETLHFALNGQRWTVSLQGSLIQAMTDHHNRLGEKRSAYIKRLILEDLERHGIHWAPDRFLPVRRTA